MSVTVVCECTNTFSLKDEYAGMTVKCPRCGRAVRAGSSDLTPASEADPIFGRNVFLMRQQLRFNERYEITDEQGKGILFVERPRHFLRNLGATLAALTAGFVWAGSLITLADMIGTTRSRVSFFIPTRSTTDTLALNALRPWASIF